MIERALQRLALENEAQKAQAALLYFDRQSRVLESAELERAKQEISELQLRCAKAEHSQRLLVGEQQSPAVKLKSSTAGHTRDRSLCMFAGFTVKNLWISRQ